MPVREVLKRIDSSSFLFQIVIDEDGVLLGTITDGDIRRAMLHGVGLDDTAQQCMQPYPVTGQVGATAENHAKIGRLGSSRTFLPIVNAEGRVREILIGGENVGVKNAIVMAGGPGTRLGERTRTTPKPLLHVDDRPILEHVIKSLESSGINRIFVSVHYLAEQIERFVAERESEADIVLLYEHKRLGTAGVLGQLGEQAPREPFLVVNGDVLTRADLSALHDFHVRHGHDGTIGVARFEVDVPFGVVHYDSDGLFAGIEEKPRISNFVAGGVYLLSPEFIGLVAPGQSIDMPELLNLGRNIGLRIGLFPIHEYWTDVGRPNDLDAADRALRVASQVT